MARPTSRKLPACSTTTEVAGAAGALPTRAIRRYVRPEDVQTAVAVLACSTCCPTVRVRIKRELF
jgi:hypothetical protein